MEVNHTLVKMIWKYIVNELSVVTTLLFIFTSVLIFLKGRRRRDLPPGPPLIPIVGNLFSLTSKDLFGTLRKLRNTYGDIYSLYIGSEIVVVLNGYETLHDALVKKGSHFINRPPSVFQKIGFDRTGILYSNGKLWKEQRAFAQKSLQNLFFKNRAQNLEEIIKGEVEELISSIQSQNGDFDVSKNIHTCALNTMFLVTYGKRFCVDDKLFVKFTKDLHEVAKHVAKMQLLANCFPFLVNLPVDVLGKGKRLHLVKQLHTFAKDNARISKESDGDVATIAEAFDRQIQEQKSGGDTYSFTEEQREDTVTDFIAAGGDTTATAIMWIILYLVREKDIQENMYKEIVTVVEKGETPLYAHRKYLPYTEAVILEGLRIGGTASLALPHSVSDDFRFHGYLIPKNSTVMINVDSVLKNPKIWELPDKFDPLRFLNSDKTEVVVPDAFIPFSLGQRSCLGETVARMEIFLVIATLVREFELLPSSTGTLPKTDVHLGITFQPSQFNMRFRKR